MCVCVNEICSVARQPKEASLTLFTLLLVSLVRAATSNAVARREFSLSAAALIESFESEVYSRPSLWSKRLLLLLPMKASKSKRERSGKGSGLGFLLWCLPLSFLGLAAHFYWHAISALYRHDSLPPPSLRATSNTTTTTTTSSSSSSKKTGNTAKAAATSSLRTNLPPTQPLAPKPLTTAANTNAPAPAALPGAANHSILSLSAAALSSTPVSDLMAPYGESEGGGSCPLDFGNALVRRWRAARRTFCPARAAPAAPAASAASAAAGAGALHSSIDCYLVSQTRHHGDGDNLCHMKNVAVDMGVFGDRGVTRPVVMGALWVCVCVCVCVGRGEGGCHACGGVVCAPPVFECGPSLSPPFSLNLPLAPLPPSHLLSPPPLLSEYVATQHMKQPYIPFKPGFVRGDCTPDPDLWNRKSMPGWNADWTVGAYE